MVLREVWESVEWMQLAKDRDQWRTLWTNVSLESKGYFMTLFLLHRLYGIELDEK